MRSATNGFLGDGVTVSDLLQNPRRMRAAFSHSLSMVVGRNVSEPIFCASLLMGAAAFDPIPERRWPQPGLTGACSCVFAGATALTAAAFIGSSSYMPSSDGGAANCG